jgi:hypothetical protein
MQLRIMAVLLQWQDCKGGFRYQPASGRCINHENKLCNPGYFIRREGVCMNHEESICDNGCVLYSNTSMSPVQFKCKCEIHASCAEGYIRSGFDCIPDVPCATGYTLRSEIQSCLSHNATMCSTDTVTLLPTRYEGVYQFNDLTVSGAPAAASDVFTIEIIS